MMATIQNARRCDRTAFVANGKAFMAYGNREGRMGS